MLLPQFSFRTLLLAVSLAAIGSLVVAAAIRGQIWAIGATLGVGMIGVAFAFYFLAFTFSYLITAVFGSLRPQQDSTPFSSQAPRQVLPTHDAD